MKGLVLACSLPLFQFQLLEYFFLLLFSLLNRLTTVLLEYHQQAPDRSTVEEAEGKLRKNKPLDQARCEHLC